MSLQLCWCVSTPPLTWPVAAQPAPRSPPPHQIRPRPCSCDAQPGHWRCYSRASLSNTRPCCPQPTTAGPRRGPRWYMKRKCTRAGWLPSAGCTRQYRVAGCSRWLQEGKAKTLGRRRGSVCTQKMTVLPPRRVVLRFMHFFPGLTRPSHVCV